MLTSVLASTTGAHLNPALTVSFMLKKRNSESSRWLGLGYIIYQLCGGVIGALTANSVFSNYAGDIRIPDGEPWINSFVIEIFGSFFISFFFHSQCDKATSISYSNRQIFAALVAGVQTFMISNVSPLGSAYGSGLNPAIALGITIAVNCDGGLRAHSYQWVFLVGPVIGALLGALFFDFLYRKHVIMHARRYEVESESSKSELIWEGEEK